MQVDIKVKAVPSYTVGSVVRTGPYTDGDMMRPFFEKVVEWAKSKKVRMGKWFFIELDGPETPGKKRRWEACVELKGRPRSGGGVKVKTLPGGTVAYVRFNPDQVSARLVYHGLEGWLSWRKKYGEYSGAGNSREVYPGNPWTSKRAWANTEVQYPIKKLNKSKN